MKEDDPGVVRCRKEREEMEMWLEKEESIKESREVMGPAAAAINILAAKMALPHCRYR